MLNYYIEEEVMANLRIQPPADREDNRLNRQFQCAGLTISTASSSFISSSAKGAS